MSTVSSTNITGTTGFSAQPGNGVHLVQNILDMVAIEATSGITLTTTEVFQAIEIPAGTCVYAAGVEVLTADSSATAKISLGDAGSVARYVAAVTIATTADRALQVPANVPFYYEDADTIDVVSSVAALSDAKIRVWAVLGTVESPLNTSDLNDWAQA